jgi:hypothetical protein
MAVEWLFHRVEAVGRVVAAYGRASERCRSGGGGRGDR